MAMKKLSDPRRIYTRNGITHICFAGKYYAPAPGQETELKVGMMVTCELDDEKNLKVTHRVPKKKGIVETWVVTEVPTIPRGTKKVRPEQEQAQEPEQELQNEEATEETQAQQVDV